MLAVAWAFSVGRVEGDAVKTIPGLVGEMSSAVFSGYIKATDGNQTWHSHYVLTESEHSPSTDPLLLWQQGGPGSSGFGFGWFAELGPYSLDAESLLRNRTATPRPFRRDKRWSAEANLLLFEHPPGTGFSYCVSEAGMPITCRWNDQTAGVAFRATLAAFFRAWPQYAAHDLHIAGESYAGLLIPHLVHQLLLHPSDVAARQLRGLAIGNGCPGTSGATPERRGACNGPYGSYDTQHIVEVVAGHGGVSRALQEELAAACGFPCRAPTWSEACHTFSPACQALLSRFSASVGEFNIYNVMDSCGPGNQARTLQGWLDLGHAAEPRPHTGGESYPCGTGDATVAYVNTPEVRRAFNMKPESFYGHPWNLGGGDLAYTTYTGSSYDLYPAILAKVPVLIYNGDADCCVPYSSNEDWVVALAAEQKYPVLQQWRPWLLGDVPAGYVTAYGTNGPGNLTFLTVKGAGHMVPQYQPERAFAFLSRWLAGGPF